MPSTVRVMSTWMSPRAATGPAVPATHSFSMVKPITSVPGVTMKTAGS